MVVSWPSSMAWSELEELGMAWVVGRGGGAATAAVAASTLVFCCPQGLACPLRSPLGTLGHELGALLRMACSQALDPGAFVREDFN